MKLSLHLVPRGCRDCPFCSSGSQGWEVCTIGPDDDDSGQVVDSSRPPPLWCPLRSGGVLVSFDNPPVNSRTVRIVGIGGTGAATGGDAEPLDGAREKA